MEMYRHGDLLIMRVDKALKGEIVKDNVLEDGEVTGHQHIANGNGVVVQLVEDTKYIHAPNGATITHQEHNPITLPPGEYSVWRQREYNPYLEAIRYVQD